MKKSLVDAIKQAVKVSKEYPDVVLIVMDGYRKKATFTSSEWIYKERILEGYYTVGKVQNGEVELC